MPTYEYRCPKGHAFDVFQKMSDPAGASCPECGEAGERVLSGGAGFLFKGDGFYITDYRSADYKKKAEADRGGAPDAAPDKASKSGGDKAASGGESKGGSGTGSSGSSGGSSGSSGSSSSGSDS